MLRSHTDDAALRCSINVMPDVWHHCRVAIFDACTPPSGNASVCTPHSVQWQLNASSGQLIAGNGFCAELQRDHTVTLQTCATPVPANQKWSYGKHGRLELFLSLWIFT